MLPEQSPAGDPRKTVPSLLILGLPRSLTSLVYRWSARALGLRAPSWTTDGEFLNIDRFTFARTGERGPGEHFLSERDGPQYRAAIESARTVLVPHDHAY